MYLSYYFLACQMVLFNYFKWFIAVKYVTTQ